MNAATQNPLMLVEIAEGSSAPFINAISANDGSFTFRDLPPGRYMVRAQREGFIGNISVNTGTPMNAASAPVTIVAGGAPAEVRLGMIRGATISGRVHDSDGQPAPSRAVTAFQVGYRNGREILVPVAFRVTDDLGEYRVFWVAPGTYYLGVTLAPAPSASMFMLQRTAQPRTFYPNAPDARSSTVLTITEGMDFTGADIELRPPATFKVSGRTEGATPGTFYLLHQDLTQLSEESVPTFTNSSTTPGVFEIQGVRPGTYDLSATAYNDTGAPFPARVRIEVGSQDLDGVTVPSTPGVEVRVRVMLDGNFIAAPLPTLPPRDVSILPVTAPQPAVFVSSVPGVVPLVQLRSREIYPAPFDSYVGPSVTSDPSGVFVFPNVPQGIYSVVASGVPQGAYVADIQAGSISIYDEGLVVGDRAPAMIDVILKSGALSIGGTVRDAAGKAVTSGTVVLVPSPTRRKNSRLYRTIRVNANGEFRLNNIAPGQYRIFAWETIANSAYMNATFLAKYEALGLSVNLVAGGNRSFDLTLIR